MGNLIVLLICILNLSGFIVTLLYTKGKTDITVPWQFDN